MLDQLGRKATRVPDTVVVTRANVRQGYLALIGRKNPLSSMRARQ